MWIMERYQMRKHAQILYKCHKPYINIQQTRSLLTLCNNSGEVVQIH